MEQNSFFKTMIDEKGLSEEILNIQLEGENITHYMPVEDLVNLIEESPISQKEVIEKTMRMIDFQNANMLDYLKFLLEAFLLTNYSKIYN
ncbi:hypothetical protein [Terribacillus saccharophilus]|uniref:hypothetical protein n=1 Tax=Terribacillus saccharophilus TaxID=361277 RepID=UPI002989C1C5|nr:hypothetical protein [Terribacillus saccharophilus]MCM3227552.1 hypothetical protein [Terribacillus saccharophilus]